MKRIILVLTIISLALLGSCVDTKKEATTISDWPILKHYDQDHLYRIALPLGGIGTGTVSLGGRGELRDWEIMNIPAKGYSTVTTGNDAPFFAIHVNQNTKKITKALLGPLYDAEYQHKEGRSVDHHGLPRFRTADFDTAYPLGMVNLSDPDMPINVRIKGFNPLIPGDADSSGIPIAILKYEVENTISEEMTVSVCGNIRNFIGKDGSEFIYDWKGDVLPTGASNNTNTFRKSDKVSGIFMEPGDVDSESQAWGTIALTSPDNDGDITYRTSSSQNYWSNSILNFWDDFSDDGQLSEIHNRNDDDPMASLSVQKTIAPGKKETFTFYLTWHFPNRYAWSKTKVGNYYCTVYLDAWDVIAKEIIRLPSLEKKTIEFVNTFLNSDLPDAAKEAALFNLSTLRSQTVFRTEDGRMFGWEGVMDSVGSCHGSCTHVWNYEQATAFLFGDLARTLRDVEFGYATNEEGKMSFRVDLPLDKKNAGKYTAADGQMGTIMKFYRDWQLLGDNHFLKKYWLQVKAALAYAWIKDGWDRDKDGIMEGDQHNTMDVNYVGPNPQMQIWYLGALKAAKAMALHMEDNEFARTCERLYENGSKWTDENLFNGEYYEQIVMSREHLDRISTGEAIGIVEITKYLPKYQLAKGCLVDQLVGQYMAHIIGLGHVINPENAKTTLQSILKYNKRENMSDHFNNMRSYAMGDESALLMASWPKGRPEVPFPYFSEVMTGFEYTAAVGMLYEGLEEEGYETIKNIRDRYDGSKRNPFDEAECGHHYARAMASWGAVLAHSQFLYSGVDKFIQFTSRGGKYFWSNGYAWGHCIVSNSGEKAEVELHVQHGELNISEIRLKDFGAYKFKTEKNLGDSISVEIKRAH